MKIENGRHFGGEENFLKIAKSTLLKYPVGRKFRQNHSISHGYGDRSKFVFFHFGGKFENSKWPPFLGREIFGKLPSVHCLDTLWVENFDEIALSHTVKEIEANWCFSILGKNPKIQNGYHF